MPRELPVSLGRLEELVGKYGTPLQLYDEHAMRANAKYLFQSFRTHFPTFRQYFAIKALPNPAVLQVLIDEGCGLDCSSSSELYSANQLKVPGEFVMFTSNYTSRADLLIGLKQGVVTNLDDLSLVKTVAEVAAAASLPFPELICFRLNPGLGRTDSETASNVLGGPSAKFGIPPFQIVECYRQAKAAGAKRFGIHMMTGSCVLNDDYWMDTVKALVDAMKVIKEEVDIEFEFMNIGGGLGIPYRAEEAEIDLEKLAGMMRARFDECGVSAYGVGGKEPKLYMENGRFLTGPFGFLVSKCLAVKDTYEVYYGLDACMAHLMRPGMYGSYHHITVPTAQARLEAAKASEGAVEGEAPNDGLKVANVVGTLCENNDWFAKARSLPPSQEDDLFVIHDTGAHSHSMGFQYNGKLRAPEVLLRGVDGARDTLIRERELVEVLYSNCHNLTEEDLASTRFVPGSVGAVASGLTAAGLLDQEEEEEGSEQDDEEEEEEEEEEGACVVQ